MDFELMMGKIFGTKHEREIKAARPLIAAINDMEGRIQELSDEELAAQTVTFKEQIAQGATLDDILIPAFATVREAGRRILNMRHFDVQLIGGLVLHRGKIAEMKTGEDAGRHAPGVSERAFGAGRARGHGQRLPGRTRLGVDGPDLQGSGIERRRHRARSGR